MLEITIDRLLERSLDGQNTSLVLAEQHKGNYIHHANNQQWLLEQL